MTISYTHVQTVPSLAWTITHNLGCAPVHDVIEVVGGVVRKILPDSVRYLDENSLLIEFTTPTAGRARLIGPYTPPALSGAGTVDLGQYYVAAQAFAFFDNFTGTAGSLDGRIPSGDTRAWNEFSAGLNLDGSGHLVADSALLHTAPTLQVPLATSYTNGFAVEVVFASPMQSGENVTGVQVFVAGDDQGYGFNFLADFPTVGDLMIQVSGGDTNNEYTMAMPTTGVPFTARLEFVGGTHVLLINGSQVMTGDIVNPLGSNVKLFIDAGGIDSSTDSMLIDSVEVEELPGTLL